VLQGTAMYTGVHPKGHLFWLIQRTYDLTPALFMGSILYILLAAKAKELQLYTQAMQTSSITENKNTPQDNFC